MLGEVFVHFLNGDKVEVIREYANDEKNTESVTRLMVHVGGGSERIGVATGIHFEVSPEQIAYAALHGLCKTGAASREELARAISELGIDPERADPLRA